MSLAIVSSVFNVSPSTSELAQAGAVAGHSELSMAVRRALGTHVTPRLLPEERSPLKDADAAFQASNFFRDIELNRRSFSDEAKAETYARAASKLIEIPPGETPIIENNPFRDRVLPAQIADRCLEEAVRLTQNNEQKINWLEGRIKLLSGGYLTADEQIKHAELSIEHADLVCGLEGSAFDKTKTATRAHQAAVKAARLLSERGDSARQARFEEAARRFGPKSSSELRSTMGIVVPVVAIFLCVLGLKVYS